MSTDDAWDHWAQTRDHEVWGAHGIASLALTQWLDASPRVVDGAPGVWRTDGSEAVASGIPSLDRLAPGDEASVGPVLLRAMERDGAVALRVFDPGAPARRGISAIVRAEHDPRARVTGRFTAAATVAETTSMDGHRGDAEYAGAVAFALDDAELSLTVQRRDDGLFAAFSDATSGTDSYRFRFLRVPGPDAEGGVVVDLNRAYLPPCAFSDHYVCVFPPAGNRWDVAVPWGELRVR